MVPWRPPFGRECYTHGGVRVVCLCALRALCARGAHRHCTRPRGTRRAMRMLFGDLGVQRHMWQNSLGASPDDVGSQSDPGQVYVPSAPSTRQRSHLSVHRCAARVRTIGARVRVASAHARARAWWRTLRGRGGRAAHGYVFWHGLRAGGARRHRVRSGGYVANPMRWTSPGRRWLRAPAEPAPTCDLARGPTQHEIAAQGTAPSKPPRASSRQL